MAALNRNFGQGGLAAKPVGCTCSSAFHSVCPTLALWKRRRHGGESASTAFRAVGRSISPILARPAGTHDGFGSVTPPGPRPSF